MRSTARSLLAAAALFAPSLAPAQAKPTPVDQLQMTPIAASTCSAGRSCVYWSSVDGKLHQRNALGVDTTVGSGGGGGSGTATAFQTSAGAPGGAATADVWFDTNANAFCGRWSGTTDCLARESLVVHLAGAEVITGVKTFSSDPVFSSEVDHALAVASSTSNNAIGGALVVSSGAGSPGSGSATGGTGGPLTIRPGAGGANGPSSHSAGTGGTLIVQGGVGGANVTGSNSVGSAPGGPLYLRGGDAGASGGHAGNSGSNAYLDGGLASTGGHAGDAYVGADATRTRNVYLGNSGGNVYLNALSATAYGVVVNTDTNNLATVPVSSTVGYCFKSAGSGAVPTWGACGGGGGGTTTYALTLGSGLSVGSFDGSAPITAAVSYGTTSGTACQGNDTRLGPAPSVGNSGQCQVSNGTAWVAGACGGSGSLPSAGVAGRVPFDNGAGYSLTSAGTSTQVLKGGAPPSFGAVALATDVSGTLPISSGGTNSGSSLSGSTIMVSNGVAIVQGAAGTTTTVLHGNAAGAPSYGAVSLAADVTGTLPAGNLPATVAYLNGTQNWSSPQTFQNAGPAKINNAADTFASSLASAATASRTWTLPDATDTACGLTATQTLTNKTLTTPTIASFTNATHSHLNAAGGGTITVASISDLAASYQPLDADLTAVAGLAATAGMLSRTGAGAFAPRTLACTNATCSWTNGDGGAGAPTLALNVGTGANSLCAGNDTRLPPSPGSAGCVLQSSGAAYVCTGPGASGEVWTSNGAGVASWQAPAGGAPSGSASGDLSGTYPGPNVAKVNGIPWSNTWNNAARPTNKAVPCYSTTSSSVEYCDTATCVAHAFIFGQGSTGPTCSAAPSNGQIPIGSTGADPVLATLTNGGGITATSGAGSITLGSSCGGDLSGNVGAASVVALRGKSLDSTIGTAGAGQDGQVVYFDNASTSYKLKTVSGSGSVTSIGIGTGLSSTQTPLTTTGTMSIDQTFSPTWSGVHNFAPNACKIDNNSTTNAHTLASTATAARTATLPDATGTLAMLGLAQSWSAAQTHLNAGRVRINNSADTLYTELTSAATANRTWTLPDATDTACGIAATQTLTNKTLTTPTIASFTNATHTHADAAGGGTLNASAIAAGTLPIARGGTNSTTALSGSSIMVSNGSAVVQGAAGTTTTLLHGNAAGAPTYSSASLTADVTGVLPVANGGTNSSASLTGNRLMASNAGATAVVEGNVYDWVIAEVTSSTTGGGAVDTTVTIPAARGSNGTKGFLITDLAFRVTQAVAGGGSVAVLAGTSAGGTDLLVSTTASGAVGTTYGDLPAELGTKCDSTRMNNCYVDGSATLTLRLAAPTGTVSTALKGVWTLTGKLR